VQLILMSGPFSNTHTFSIRRVHVVMMGIFTLLLVLGLVASGFYLAVRYSNQWADIEAFETIRSDGEVPQEAGHSGVQTPVDAMAARLAEMRAQLARLEAISSRLLKLSGMDDKSQGHVPVGQGGLQQKDERALSVRELKAVLKEVSAKIERQADVLNILDADMQLTRSRFQSIPNALPLSNVIPVSNFGARIDPFSGRQAQHEGIDFMAPTGTPIFAAAAGVVTNAAYHVGYGNLVEIEHDQKTTTRYAHASKLLVKQGDVVRLGQVVALVGSTGRSTGPHLHFEVRVDGQAKNPTAFFTKQNLPPVSPSTLTALNGILLDSPSRPLD
jgi:murein DD-endopeptidase MepM/ murein hydrolase activator NlpD